MKNSSVTSTVLFFLILASIGDVTIAKKSSRPRATAAPPAKLGRSGRPGPQSNRPPVSQRRKYEDDDDDEDFDREEIRFPGDGDDEEDGEGESIGDVEDEENDILGPIAPRNRRSGFDDDADDEEVLTPLPNKRRKGEPLSRREPPPSAKLSASRTAKGARNKGSPPPNRKGQQPPNRRSRLEEDEYDEEDFERPRGGPQRRGNAPPPRGDRRQPPPGKYNRGRGPPNNRGKSGAVVPHQASKTAAAFTRGLSALREAMPDPSIVKEAAVASLNAARSTTSALSANLYREVKGLTSSELEQVMLKATRPDDSPVKGKHVERLVGVTYQISSKYDIYDAVLRKLWGKMAEKDWRTKVKALYILHRFAADGSPDHAAALKARLRELRRTRDPKRKEKFFNSKQLLAGDATPDNASFRAFMSRYAHYVLLRAQCFGGMFEEISVLPSPAVEDSKRSSKVTKPQKPITATSLRKEHLEAAIMLLKAGVACQLKEGEENENTAIAVERVASDLIGLTTAVAIALNRALKEDDLKGADPALIKKWAEFYRDELLPQTRAMVKKTSSKLDAYGLFLPSRMGTSVSPELLQKGVNLLQPETSTTTETKTEEETAEDGATAVSVDAKQESKETSDQPATEAAKVEAAPEPAKPATPTEKESSDKDDAADGEGDEDEDEYEYEDDDEYEDEED